MTLRQKKQVKAIKNVLSSQRFYDFYKDGGEYDKYIANGRNQKGKVETEINEKILEMFANVVGV